jgi:hypothetical protein
MAEEEENTKMGSHWFKMGEESMKAGLGAKQSNNFNMGNMVGKAADMINAFGSTVADKEKAIHKEKMDKIDSFGDGISTWMVDMGETFSNLPKEAFNQAITECTTLRDEYYNAVNTGDTKAQGEIMIKMNQVKERHAGDAEAQKDLVDILTGVLDTETGQRDPATADFRAMNPEHLELIKNFTTAEDRSITYIGDPPVLHHTWTQVSEGGELVAMKKTNKELNDMVVIKQTVNGTKLIDYLSTATQANMVEGAKMPSDNSIRSSIDKIIPKKKTDLISWFKSNPSEIEEFDAHGYLQDNLANFSGTLGELKGMETYDSDEDASNGIQIAQEDMQKVITMIMDCENPEISRKILVEIMADISKSKIGGLPLKNYNHKPIEGASVVADAERQKNVDAMYNRLQDTTTGAQEQLQKDLKGKTKEQVAAYFNITVEDAQKLRYNKGGFVDIDSFMNNSGREKYNPGTNGGKN